MFRKIIFIILLIPFLAVLGCGKCPVITKSGDTSRVEAKAGEEFTVSLFANPSTGYTWELAKPLDKDLLELVSAEHSGGNPMLVGSGCQQEWKFKALKPGKALISLKYHRPWEKLVPPAKIEEFEVSIK
jgi:inhibitor of cysteine peptidase